MTDYQASALRRVLGAAIGIACLFVGDRSSSTQDSMLIAQANARANRPLMSRSVAGVARHATRRAVVIRAAIPYDFGYSAGAGISYGYAPGTYGGVGCYRGASGTLVCP